MKLLKRVSLLLLLLALFLTMASAASLKIKVNGELKSYAVAPMEVDDRVFVPLPYIAKDLGCDVNYTSSTGAVQVTNKVVTLNLQVGSQTMTKQEIRNDEAQTFQLEAAPRVVNGVVMVPVRMLAEGIGATVSWDSSTQTVSISLQYDYIGSYSNGYAIVVKGEYYGLIDKKGDIAIPIKYSWLGNVDAMGYIRAFSAGRNGLLYYLDTMPDGTQLKNHVVLPCEFSTIDMSMLQSDGSGYIIAKKNDSYATYTASGENLMPAIARDLSRCSSNPELGLITSSNGQYGLYEYATGKLLVQPAFDKLEITAYHNYRALLAVQKNGKWAFANMQGDVLTSYVFSSYSASNDFVTAVQDGHQYQLEIS